jgi:glycosyltransferase involved in cell wall biosynthesis
MRNILNLAQKNKKLKCLTSPTHERYQSNMSDIDCEFYMYRDEGIKEWTDDYANLPKNHFILPPKYIPFGIDFDFVLSQNRFGQFQKLAPIAYSMNIPLITLEHTLPAPFWDEEFKKQVASMRGDINLYISTYSAKQWGDPKYITVPHCIDDKVFNNNSNFERKKHILSVANDFINRDYALNFKQYIRVTNGLPVFRVGDTPGFSKAAESTEQLVAMYQSSRIFINTAHWSPIPMSLLEAMACGCAVVSCNSCAIPEYIENGKNGFLANNDKEMRLYLELLLKDEKLAKQLGDNAAITILEKCKKEKFTKTWNTILEKTRESKIINR